MKQKTKAKKMSENKISYQAFFACLATLSIWIGSLLMPQTSPDHASVKDRSSVKDARPSQGTGTSADRPSNLNSEVQKPAVEEAGSSKEESKQGFFSDAILKELENASAPLSSVCGTLPKIDREQNKIFSQEELTKRFEDSVFGRSADPTFESVKPILRYMLSQPSLKAILGRDESLERSPATMRAYTKYQGLLMNRERLESILDQTYLLYMLGKSVAMNPELANDREVMNYCNAIESELNQNGKSDFLAEKKAFAEFLKTAKIDPDMIGFDPKYKSDIDLQLAGDALGGNIGWLNGVTTTQ
jgi:hypothetical protein